MNRLPDWVIFVLFGIALLLASGGGAWRGFKFLLNRISRFIGRYTWPD